MLDKPLFLDASSDTEVVAMSCKAVLTDWRTKRLEDGKDCAPLWEEKGISFDGVRGIEELEDGKGQ